MEEDRKVLVVQWAAAAALYEAAMVVSHAGWCRCGHGSKPASSVLVIQLQRHWTLYTEHEKLWHRILAKDPKSYAETGGVGRLVV